MCFNGFPVETETANQGLLLLKLLEAREDRQGQIEGMNETYEREREKFGSVIYNRNARTWQDGNEQRKRGRTQYKMDLLLLFVSLNVYPKIQQQFPQKQQL